MKKLMFLLALLSIFLMGMKAVYASSYFVLAPDASSSCFNASFNQTAVLISSQLNASLLYFDCDTLSSISTSLQPYNPDYVVFVLQPTNVTPDLLTSMEEELRNLDGDTFLDVPYSIITGFDNESAWNLFSQSMDGVWSDNYALFVNQSSFLKSALSTTSLIKYEDGNVNITRIKNALSATYNDLIYFALPYTSYTTYLDYYGKRCPEGNSSYGIVCEDGDITISNLLWFFDSALSGRVYGSLTNPKYSPYATFDNPTVNDFKSSIPIGFAKKGSGYDFDKGKILIAPHSDRWQTMSNFFKIFYQSLTSGNSVAQSLLDAKNYYYLTKQVYGIVSAFPEYISSSYVLYGADVPSGINSTQAIDFTTTYITNKPVVIYFGNNSVPVEWNESIKASLAKDIPALYSSGWQTTDA